MKVRRVAQNYTNAHWRVTTLDGDVFLRRSVAPRTGEAVEYGLALLDRLATRGWPVPRPASGCITEAGRVWVAFEALQGRPRQIRSEGGRLEEQRTRGVLLARLHADMNDVTELGQRPGSVRAEDSFGHLEAQLGGLARTHPAEARSLQQHLDDTRQALAALHAEQQPVQIVHGDFSTWNLLFADKRLSGVLDFDLARLDHRVADFALSARGGAEAVLSAYDEVSPLSDMDWALLVPVFRAWYLSQASEKFVGTTIPAPQLGFVLNHLNNPPIATRR